MKIAVPKGYLTGSMIAHCYVELCVYGTKLICRVCYRAVCGPHAYRDEVGKTIDICCGCASDAAIALVSKGIKPLDEKVTVDQIRALAQFPTHLIPSEGKNFEQTQRWERELGTDPTMLGKIKLRCGNICTLDDKGTATMCIREKDHGGLCESSGGRQWNAAQTITAGGIVLTG